MKISLMEGAKNSGADIPSNTLIGLLPHYPEDFASEDLRMLFAIEKKEKWKTSLKERDRETKTQKKPA